MHSWLKKEVVPGDGLGVMLVRDKKSDMREVSQAVLCGGERDRTTVGGRVYGPAGACAVKSRLSGLCLPPLVVWHCLAKGWAPSLKAVAAISQQRRHCHDRRRRSKDVKYRIDKLEHMG